MAAKRGGAGWTVSEAGNAAPPCEAVIVTTVGEETTPVVTANVADAVPAVTRTDGGTWATAGSDVVSRTTVPPAGAIWLSVTVPVTGSPTRTLVRSSASPERLSP